MGIARMDSRRVLVPEIDNLTAEIITSVVMPVV